MRSRIWGLSQSGKDCEQAVKGIVEGSDKDEGACVGRLSVPRTWESCYYNLRK